MSSEAVAPEPERLSARGAVGFDVERDIELVLAFLNTYDAEAGTDALCDRERWQWWCAERGLRPMLDTTAARDIRDAMRAAADDERTFDGALPAGAPSWPTQITLRGGIPVLTGTDALGEVLASAVRIVSTGHWDRIKICPASDCLLAFYDRSRNRSRTWCSMRICGNREKARSWRERHASAE